MQNEKCSFSTFSAGGTILPAVGPVAQTSQSAGSRASKPAGRPAKAAPPIWKSATQQVGKPALRDGEDGEDGRFWRGGGWRMGYIWLKLVIFG